MNKKNTIIKQYNVIKSHKNTANIYNPKKKKLYENIENIYYEKHTKIL